MDHRWPVGNSRHRQNGPGAIRCWEKLESSSSLAQETFLRLQECKGELSLHLHVTCAFKKTPVSQDPAKNPK